jgi:hypothetical protein
MNHSVPNPATARVNRATALSHGDEGLPAEAGAPAMATLLMAWHAALDHRVPAVEGVALLPSPSRTEAAVRAVLQMPHDATTATPLTALEHPAPVALQAEFRTAPGEQWQLGVQREPGASGFDLSLRAAFVPPSFAATQLPRLHGRLRQQAHAVDRLVWRDDGRNEGDPE